MKTWIYHEPVFECDAMQPVLMKYSPWAGLRFLVYDLVYYLNPGTIVELGTHYGCSAFTFLQVIKDYRLPARFFTIDHWMGDAWTKNDYRDPVCEEFLSVFERYYDGYADAVLLKGSFQSAAWMFRKGEISLLHIDGSHGYTEVKRDFQDYAPLVSEDGIILMHDIGEELFQGEPMGSCVFWKELKKSGKFLTMDIPYSCGLGILAKRRDVFEDLQSRIFPEYYRRKNDGFIEEGKAKIREMFFEVRDLKRANSWLSDQAEDLKKEKRRPGR